MQSQDAASIGEPLAPELIVKLFYHSLYSGDLQTIKSILTPKSYLMTLESFGLRLALKDPLFKSELSHIDESDSSLQRVEEMLSDELASRKRSPQLSIIDTEENGPNRTTVSYAEDGKYKKLYFSHNGHQWLIDYFAGRPVV